MFFGPSVIQEEISGETGSHQCTAKLSARWETSGMADQMLRSSRSRKDRRALDSKRNQETVMYTKQRDTQGW